MRRIALFLGATTLLFAGLSVYLALQLRAERETYAQIAAPASAPPAPPQVAGNRAPNVFAPVATTSHSATSATNGTPPAEPPFLDAEVLNSDAAAARQKYVDGEKRFLEDIADPTKRQQLLDQAKYSSRAPFPGMARHLGLTDEEADRLFTLMAEQQLVARERQARCVTSPDCNYRGFTNNEAGTLERQLADELGPERHARFQQYQQTLAERQTVATLRSGLPDRAFLNEQRAEELVSALYEERTRFQDQMLGEGGGFSGYGTGAGMIYVGEKGTLDERLASARGYSDRLRERAAQVLTPEQAKNFNQMQDELLANLRDILRSQERQKAAGGDGS
jgi:hypothetical protein